MIPEPAWRFDMENAPRDGRLIIVPGGVAYWRLEAADITGNDQGGRWYTITGEPFPGLPIEWAVRAWLPFPPPPYEPPCIHCSRGSKPISRDGIDYHESVEGLIRCEAGNG